MADIRYFRTCKSSLTSHATHSSLVVRCLLLSIHVSAVFVRISAQNPAPPPPQTQAADAATLLSIKNERSFKDPFGVTKSWDQPTNVCINWNGTKCRGGRVSSISLIEAGISGAFPTTFAQLQGLTSLDLSVSLSSTFRIQTKSFPKVLFGPMSKVRVACSRDLALSCTHIGGVYLTRN